VTDALTARSAREWRETRSQDVGTRLASVGLSPPPWGADRDHREPVAEDPGSSAPPIIVSPTALAGKPIPERKWIVREWIPRGVVTGLYGDGGLGKSLLAQQLQTSAALGLPWLSLPVEQVASLGVYCEDAHDELWRRQATINEGYSVDFDALGEVHWMPRLGEGNLLMTFARNGVGELTKFHANVLGAARDLEARLVIVDTAADVFGGNENDRGQVRQFVSRALGSIAQTIDGAVLLCAHPSRSGLSTGEGDGGSTGWSNSLRSRLYLRAPETEASETPDPNARILQRRKANYAARNDELRVRWRNGIIEPEPPIGLIVSPFGRLEAADLFLALLDEFTTNKRSVCAASRAGNYAPRMFAKLPREQRQDYRETDFMNAMERLFASRKIENIDYGRAADMRQMIARVRANQ
jgi:RecA-family ATPase